MAFSEANDRIFYACQAVLMERVEDGPPAALYNPTSAIYLAGVRSVGVNGDFPSTSLMDVGRFQRKWHFYGKQSFEITLERVINHADNTSSVRNSFFYESDYSTYKGSHILAAGNFGDKGTADGSDKHLAQYHITILYGPDKFAHFGSGLSGSDADKDKVHSITYEYCLVTSLGYRFDVGEGLIESVTLTTRSVKNNSAYQTLSGYSLPGSAQSGDIIKRADIDILATDGGDPDDPDVPPISTAKTILPSEINTMFDLSTQATLDGDDNRTLGLTSIDINIGFNYTEVDDIGRWVGSDQTSSSEQNLWKFLNLPVEITASFTGTTRQVFPSGLPYGDYSFGSSHFRPNPADSPATGYNTDWQETNEQIRIVAKKFPSGPTPTYFIWDLGKRNYLTSIDHSGGDTGGGNVETTFTYQNDTSDIVIARDTSVLNLTYPVTSPTNDAWFPL